MGDQPSKLTKEQKRKYGPVPWANRGYGTKAMIRAYVRYDDQCGNGHNTFAITGDIYVPGERDIRAGGCIHEEIAAAFPELSPLVKWHLCGSNGPLHYIANTVHYACDRDHYGLRKGERKQLMFGGHTPCWERVMRNEKGEVVTTASYGDNPGHVHSHEKPTEVLTAAWEPTWIVGAGKERQSDFARRSAVWPEATDGDLTAPGLEERLKARLPALMREFKAAVESLGFVY